MMQAVKKWTVLYVVMVFLAAFSGGCHSQKEAAEEIHLTEETDRIKEQAAEPKKDVQEEPGQEEPGQEEPDHAEGLCTVYVCGAVNAPGVYELSAGSRIYMALAAAGGMTGEADSLYLNQAREIADGEQIYVPTKEEAQELATQGKDGDLGKNGEASREASGGKVNLNTAGREELMTIPGIGSAKADSILSYRQEHGPFTSTEELMQIPGIKEGVFQKMKDHITVA